MGNLGGPSWAECVLCAAWIPANEDETKPRVCGVCVTAPHRLFAVALRTRDEGLFRKAAHLAAGVLLTGARLSPNQAGWLRSRDNPYGPGFGVPATMPDDYEDDPRPWAGN